MQMSGREVPKISESTNKAAVRVDRPESGDLGQQSLGSMGEDGLSMASAMQESQSVDGRVDQAQEKFFHKVLRPAKPYKRAHFVAVSGRDGLEAALLKDPSNPDLNFAMKLGMHLLVGDFNKKCTKVGCMLLEFAYNRGVNFTAKEQKAAAKGHLDIFISEGLYGEQFHLRRAQALYMDLIASIEDGKDGYYLKPDDLVQARMEYCVVLQGLNEGHMLGTQGGIVAHFLGEQGLPGMEIYALLAGSGYKEAVNHDQAADLFFMCINEGTRLPGQLTRVDLLFVITRNLNMLEARRAAKDGREYIDDYKMIHLQAIQDHSCAADTAYEDWLNSWETWRSVADRCIAVNAYALAADLYGQGLTRDHSTYQNSRIWWKLAKCYYRCGRLGDARSAIAQALAFAPHQAQYRKVAQTWWDDPNEFEKATHVWSITKIMSLLPENETMEVPAHRKMSKLLVYARIRWQEHLRREAELEAIRKLNEAKEAALREGLFGSNASGRVKPKKDRTKKTPKIVWKAPLPIIYPSKLTPKECSATCRDMDGDFEYFPGTDDPPLPAGEHNIEVEFTPKNTDKFNCELASVTLVVKKAKPVIKWRNPPPLYYGTPLTWDTHLNAKLITVAGATDTADGDGKAGGSDRDRKKALKKQRKQAGQSLDFSTSDRGNAEQLVDPPEGSMEYYVEDQDLALPPEDKDERIYNDEYYMAKAGLLDEEENKKNLIPWPLLDGDGACTLPEGAHRVLMVFTPTDRRNYLVVRTFVTVTILPKVVPKLLWEPPEDSLMFRTPLSKIELNARGHKVAGKFKYYHILTKEDMAEPSFVAEVERARQEYWVARRERDEMAAMATEDADVDLILNPPPPDEEDTHGGTAEGEEGIGKTAGEVNAVGAVGGDCDTQAAAGTDEGKTGDDRGEHSMGALLEGLNEQHAKKSKKKRRKKGERKRRTEKEDTDTAEGQDGGTVTTSATESFLAPLPELPASEDLIPIVADYNLKRRRISPGYILPAGLNTLLACFTPRDDVMYDVNEIRIPISVVKAQPEIIWGDKNASFDSGTAILPAYSDSLLSPDKHLIARLSNDLDGYGSGTFFYTIESVEIQDDDSRVVVPRNQTDPGYRPITLSRKPKGLTGEDVGLLPKGYHAMTVKYTPKDKRNHEEAEKTIYFTVRCRPNIVWDSDYIDMVRSGVPITYEDQLRASVDECPGEIVYTPGDGDTLEIGVYQLKATFIPTDQSIHDITHLSVPFQVVRKLIPEVNWTIESIRYGDLVDQEKICRATSPIDGYFTYNLQEGTQLDAGSYSVVAVFHPADSITYASTSTVEQLVVEPLETSIAFVPERGRHTFLLTYGDPLVESLFCAVLQSPDEDEVPSHFGVTSYSHEEGQYLPVGEHELTVRYTIQPPYDRNYLNCSATTIIRVEKYAPKLVWKVPNPVVFGTGCLSDKQLCAKLKYDHIVPSWLEEERQVADEIDEVSEDEGQTDDDDGDDDEAEREGPCEYAGDSQATAATDLETEVEGQTEYGGGSVGFTLGLAENSEAGVRSIWAAPEQGGPVNASGVEGEGADGSIDVDQQTFNFNLNASQSINSTWGAIHPGGFADEYGSVVTGQMSSLSPGGALQDISIYPASQYGGGFGTIDGSVSTATDSDRGPSYKLTAQAGAEQSGSPMQQQDQRMEAVGGLLTNNLSQVSLGIYTDHGSTIALDSVGGGEGGPEGAIPLDGEERGDLLYTTTSTSAGAGAGAGAGAAPVEEERDEQCREDGERESKAQTTFTDAPESSQGDGEGRRGPSSAVLPYLEEGEQRGAEAFGEVKAEDEDEGQFGEGYVPPMPNPPREQLVPHRPPELHGDEYLQGKKSIIDKLRGVKVSGRFRYTPGKRHVLPHAGIFPLRAVFIPDDGENVGSAEVTVNVTVLRARPIMEWRRPQPMFAGTALSKLQLCATVHCPGLMEGDGHIEYFPNRGEVLPVGMHVLRCRYVPFKFCAHNFDCTHSWAEVPVLVKPKPFNMAYLDNLAPPKTGIIKRKLPRGDTGFVDTSRGRANWVSGMPWPDGKEEVQKRAATAGAAAGRRAKTPSGALGVDLNLPASSARRVGTAGGNVMRRTGSAITSSSGGDVARSSTAPVGSKKPLYSREDEAHISPRTQREMNRLEGNIAVASSARVRAQTALTGSRASGSSGADLYEKSYIQVRSEGTKRPVTTSGRPAAQNPSTTHFETVDAAGNAIQIDAFGRIMAIDMNTIEQYTGARSADYDGTLYDGMAEGAAPFTSGIPIDAEVGGDSKSYLLRDLDLEEYRQGEGPHVDRINIRQRNDSEASSRSQSQDGKEHGVHALPSIYAGAPGGDLTSVAGFDSHAFPSDNASFSTHGYEGAAGVIGDGHHDFVELRASASRGGYGYEGYGYTHSTSHFPSRSPSPEGGHGLESGQRPGLERASVAERPLTVEEEPHSRRTKGKKKKRKGEYQMSHSLSLGIRKPSTAPAGALTRKPAPRPGEEGYLPVFHFGTGNTGKNTSKKSLDTTRKNTPKTQPFKWSYYVDVRNVFDERKKAKVAGERVPTEKKGKREGKYLSLDAPADLRHSREGLDSQVGEEAARRKLVRIERQINSLRRDALGIAKMVQYTETLRDKDHKRSEGRAKTTGSATRPMPAGPHAGEDDAHSLASSDSVDSSEGGMGSAVARALKGLDRIPGIGTGAARRIASSYEYSHPYEDLTMPTGVWDSSPTKNYQSSTSASDRLTDFAKKKKAGGNAVNLRSPIKRPGTSGN